MNIYVFIWMLVASVIPFVWLAKIRDNLLKFFYGFFVFFIFIYCGLGLAFDEPKYYAYGEYYTIYMFVFGLSSLVFYKKDVKINTNTSINVFSIKHSSAIICIYFIFYLVPLITDGKLGNLLNPPMPDLVSSFSETDFTKNALSNVIESIRFLFMPLFFLALYKYIRKPIVVIFIFLLTIYMDYCYYEYAGRSGLAVYAIFVFLISYKYYPKLRKPLLLGAFAIIPLAIIFFAVYADVRQGATSSDKTSLNIALEFLYETELTYYRWFESIINNDAKYALNYLVWLITLPLPGFLKPFDMNFNFTAQFTMDVLGFSDAYYVDNILLPSLINESIFLFGKYLFFIHAIILAFIFNLTYNSLKKDPANFMLLVYIMLPLCFRGGRAGTFGPYAPIIKVLFVYFLFYYFTKRRKIRVS